MRKFRKIGIDGLHSCVNMVTVMLMMVVGGISLVQVVSDPYQVTLRWLRLGGIIALSLLAVATTIHFMASDPFHDPGMLGLTGLAMAACAGQLMCVQMAYRRAARVMAGLAFGLVGVAVAHLLSISPDVVARPGAGGVWVIIENHLTAFVGAGVMGGFLMTMLLGHAYLTAGNEMTQAPFKRLVWTLGILLVLRGVASAWAGLWPFLAGSSQAGMERVWNVVMVTARYGVGLVVPAVFVLMVADCVNRRANQSATGILYVASVLVLLGEGIALALFGSTGFVF